MASILLFAMVNHITPASGKPYESESAIYGLGLGVTGSFAAVAVGFCIYAALLVRTVIGVRTPDAALATTA